jgi:hypothetical protein
VVGTGSEGVVVMGKQCAKIRANDFRHEGARQIPRIGKVAARQLQIETRPRQYKIE